MKNDIEVTKEEYNLLDYIAELIIDPDYNLEDIIKMYKSNPLVQAPKSIYMW